MQRGSCFRKVKVGGGGFKKSFPCSCVQGVGADSNGPAVVGAQTCVMINSFVGEVPEVPYSQAVKPTARCSYDCPFVTDGWSSQQWPSSAYCSDLCNDRLLHSKHCQRSSISKLLRQQLGVCMIVLFSNDLKV